VNSEAIIDADLAATAAAYVTAYDAWWSSMTGAPFNAEKPAGHRNLTKVARDAWRAFDQALQERGIETGDRLALARELMAR
jgi:hypothetical protein